MKAANVPPLEVSGPPLAGRARRRPLSPRAGGHGGRSPRPSARLALPALVVAAALACGCGGSRTSRATPGEQAGPEPEGGGARQLRSFSDLDPVLSLATTDSHLWVATPDGLLRYDLAGGEPLRVGGEVGPGARIVAVGADRAGGLYALGEGGLARFHDGAWSRSPGGLPEIGALTALVVGEDGALFVGGTAGLAAFRGGRWSLPTEPSRVTALGLGSGASVLVGSEAGLLRLEADAVVTEHGEAMPCEAIRSVAEAEGGIWAICDRAERSVLARLDGLQWTAYTAPVPGRVADLGQCGDRLLLLTERGLFRVTSRPADQALAAGEVPLVALAPAARARPRQYRPPPRTSQPGPGRPGAKQRPEPRPFAPLPARAARAEEGGEGSAPRPLLRPVEVPVREGGRVVRCDDRGIWVGTEGLGVVRVARRGREQAFRTLDLVTERPFTVAADRAGHAWVVTRDGRAGVLEDSGFATAVVEPDPTAGLELLAFAGRGLGAFALGRVRGSRTYRVYRLEQDGWAPLLSRVLALPQAGAGEPGEGSRPASEGELQTTFFRVDPAGRFWIGLAVAGTEPLARRGVAVVDRQTEEVTYHGQQPVGPGAVLVPDDLAAIDFTRSGEAWLGGLTGATVLQANGTVRRYGESNGLVGEIVNDVAIDGRDVPWVATTAGVGRFVDGLWRFFLDALPRNVSVTALAIDSRGEVWGGGARGAVHFDGERWEVITRRDGLVSDAVRSVHVDGRDRVWFVTDAGLTLLERD